jgi:hypothetical protein
MLTLNLSTTEVTGGCYHPYPAEPENRPIVDFEAIFGPLVFVDAP